MPRGLQADVTYCNFTVSYLLVRSFVGFLFSKACLQEVSERRLCPKGEEKSGGCVSALQKPRVARPRAM